MFYFFVFVILSCQLIQLCASACAFDITTLKLIARIQFIGNQYCKFYIKCTEMEVQKMIVFFCLFVCASGFLCVCLFMNGRINWTVCKVWNMRKWMANTVRSGHWHRLLLHNEGNESNIFQVFLDFVVVAVVDSPERK